MSKLEAHRSRFKRMILIDMVCVVVAVLMALGAVRGGPQWLWGGFAVALAVAFAAQIWFVAGFLRAQKGA